MDFENELIPGVLIKRYKRFFADIKLKNKIITAHCPNSGTMFNLLKEGNPVWFTESKNDKRKLKYTLQIIEVEGNKFCINTHITNKVIEEALKNKLIEDLNKYELVRAEKKFGKNTRFDFFLADTENDKKAFLEVKSVSLSRKKGHAEFPDAVTERGKKHLENLILAIEQGFESYLIFLIQIEKCKSFNIASDIDPVYFEMLKKALKKNVKFLCYDCKFSTKGIKINKKINFLENE
jgi:sugar fermentation stimulation protein A